MTSSSEVPTSVSSPLVPAMVQLLGGGSPGGGPLVGLLVGEGHGLALPLGVGELLDVGELLALGELLDDGLPLGVGDPLGLGEPLGPVVSTGTMAKDREGEGDGDALAVDDADWLGDADGDPLVVGLPEGDGQA